MAPSTHQHGAEEKLTGNFFFGQTSFNPLMNYYKQRDKHAKHFPECHKIQIQAIV